MSDEVIVVVGLGEVGRPLYNILRKTYHCVGVDIQPVDVSAPCSVLHICIPYQNTDFAATTCEYIAKYRPQVTVIHSTIAPGTTRMIAKRSASPVGYSPVRGKHARMESDMLRYRKFVGAEDKHTAEAIARHFELAGFKTSYFCNATAGEVAKLIETTWLGVLVGWAQEVERIGLSYGVSFEEIDAFIEEIGFLPHHITPGFIGGHCVMPNIEILRREFSSHFLDAIAESNERKTKEREMEQKGVGA